MTLGSRISGFTKRLTERSQDAPEPSPALQPGAATRATPHTDSFLQPSPLAGKNCLPGPRPRTAVLPQGCSGNPTQLAAPHGAQAALEQSRTRMDQHGADTALASASKEILRKLASEQQNAHKEIGHEQPLRQEAVKSALTQRDEALTHRTEVRGELSRLKRALDQALSERPAYQQTVARLRQQRTEARSQLAHTHRAVRRAHLAATVHIPQHLLQAQTQQLQAQQKLDDINATLSRAEEFAREHEASIGEQTQQLQALSRQMNEADTQLEGKQDALTQAEQAQQSLNEAQRGLKAALDTHLPQLQAQQQPNQTAEEASRHAIDAHKQLATLTRGAEGDARAAQQACAQRDGQEQVVRQLTRAYVDQASKLAPDGALKTRAGQAQARYEQELEAFRQRHGARPLANDAATRHARQRFDRAHGEWREATKAVHQQQNLVDRLQADFDAQHSQLTALRQQADAATGQADSSEQKRAAFQQQVDRIDEAAQQAHAAREQTRPAAHDAEQAIRGALDDVWKQLAPPPAKTPAEPAKSTWRRGVDGLRGGLQSLSNRASPPQYEITVGPFSKSSAKTQPTGFNGSQAPLRKPTTSVLSDHSQKVIDHRTDIAASNTAAALSHSKNRLSPFGSKALATTTDAMKSAVSLAQEVERLFPGREVGSTAPGVFANQLLEHPNPRPDRAADHPLRHEEALLIASALSTVTSDPAVAAKVYDRLWNDKPTLDGVVTRAADSASPMAGLAAEPATGAAGQEAEVTKLANATRRALAGSASGMEALLHLQGLTLPPAEHADRAAAEDHIEHYMLSLRAEEALLNLKLDVKGAQGHADFEAAVRAHPAEDRLLDAQRLGMGRRGMDQGLRTEHPATLASQALIYAEANMNRKPGEPERHHDFKPAYVALRNGFTQGGHDSDFNTMVRRLQKFVVYIDRASEHRQGAINPSPWQRIKHTAQNPRHAVRRAMGKDKEMLTSMLRSGLLGADLGTVPVEYRKQLDETLADASKRLRDDLQARSPQLGAADLTRATLKLAAMELWTQKLASASEPQQRPEISKEELRQHAVDLASELPSSPSLDARTLNEDITRQLEGGLTPQKASAWFADGRLADPRGARSDEVAGLKDAFLRLEGKGKAAPDTARQEMIKKFDEGTPDERRELLREALLAVVTSGDMMDFADGRKNALSLIYGFSPGGAVVNGRGIGVTPVVEASYERVRTAVLRAGVSSNSGVLYLGTEAEHSATLGGGLRAGVKVDPADFTAAVSAKVGGSYLNTQGMMIRTNKHGREYLDLPAHQQQGLKSANWKQMSEVVVNSIFDLAGTGNSRPANGNEMWHHMVDKVGDYRDISFGWTKGSTASANWSVQVDGTAALKAGVGDAKASFGANGSVGIKHTFLNRARQQDTAGQIQNMQTGAGQKLVGTAGGSVGIIHPSLSQSNGSSISLFSRHKVGVETELIASAANGFARITTEGGRVNPQMSVKQREYNVEDDFVKLVNRHRDTWEAHLGDRGPDGKLHNGKEALDRFLAQLAALPKGRARSFVERKTLRPEAADSINAHMARLDLMQRSSAPPDARSRDEIAALQRKIDADMRNEDNWEAAGLVVSEQNTVTKEMTAALEVRGSPKERDNPRAAPTNLGEATRLAGGKLTLGAQVNVVNGGRGLLAVDAQPVDGESIDMHHHVDGHTAGMSGVDGQGLIG